jgi:alpha-D-ribose 1-methylphosphonate 5-triphosphate diphosphatase PhnM
MAQSTHLLAETVADDAGLLERGVLIEGVRQDIVRDVVAEVADE